MNSIQKFQYRKPKQKRSQERFEEVLACAAGYIEQGRLESFTLGDLLQDLEITVGSLYHLFPSKEAVLVALTHQAHDAFEGSVSLAAAQKAKDWRELLRIAVGNACEVYRSSPVAQTLILGPGYIWPVRMADASRNALAAERLMALLQERFGAEASEARVRRMSQAITVMDALFRKSFEDHGAITDEYLALGQEQLVVFMAPLLEKPSAK